MKIKLLFTCLFVFAASIIMNAQNGKHTHTTLKKSCGVLDNQAFLRQNDPKYDQKLFDAEQIIQQWIASHPQAANRSLVAPPDTIPLVVHVVWKTAVQNISDAQIQSQIDVLNEDFMHTNPDSIHTPAPFLAIAGRIPYYFILARQDPNGVATTGIERRQTTVASFGTNNLVKAYSTGGMDSWNTALYLNIWVCNITSPLIGYGEFPTGTVTPTRGLVMGYNYTGRVGPSLASPYNLGKSATHEIGHCFNLLHIWGDDGTACTGSDQVGDTPNQADETYTPSAFPMLDACATVAPGRMFANYMDYTDDSAMTMFTNGQATRMQAAINSFYPNLANSIGTQYPVAAANDGSLISVVSPSGNVCSNSTAPVVQLLNLGTNTLTSITFDYYFDANTPTNYVWSGSLASGASVNVTLPALPSTTGSHTFSCTISLPNGNPDPSSANNTQTSTFKNIVVSSPVVQGFDVPVFPPANYSVDNPDGLTTWVRSPAAHHGGNASLKMDNATYAASGEFDDFNTPSVDLSSLANPVLKFWLAYQLYTDPTLATTYSDTLQILASTDCGQNWTSVYKKFSTALTTAIPVWDTLVAFVPTSSQWREETVSLASFTGSNSVIFKFRNINDYENNLYIDDINIDNLTSINTLSSGGSFVVYPNPGKGVFHLNATGLNSDAKSIEVYNLLGEAVYSNTFSAGSSINADIDLSGLNSGIYFLKLTTGNDTGIQKLMISK